MRFVKSTRTFRIIFLIAIFLSTNLFGKTSSEPISLEEAYRVALNNKDYITRTKSLKEQSKARYKASVSRILPEIKLSAQYGKDKFEDKTSKQVTQSDVKYGTLLLSQPIFQGGILSAVQREKANEDIANLSVNKSDLDLYLNVAQSFYKIQSLEKNLEILKEVNDISNKRIDILKKRVAIGRSQETDLLTNELQNESIKAEVEQTSADLASEKETFLNLTLLDAETTLLKKMEIPKLETLDFYLNHSRDALDISIQEKNTYIAEKEESIQRSQHLPKLSLELSASRGKMSSVREGDDVSGFLKLEMPLFQGGRVLAQTQEMEWKKNQEKANLSQLKRDVESEVRNQFVALKKWTNLFGIYEKTVKTSQKNYQVSNKQFDLGLITNLDLLNSINTYLSAKKNLNEAYYQLKLSELQMKKLTTKGSL